MKKFLVSMLVISALLFSFSVQCKEVKPDPKEHAMEMEYRRFGNKYIIRINPEQNLVSTLQKFCESKKIMLGSISGIGSLNSVTLGFFNPNTKEYQQKTFKEPLEMANLTGNIVEKDGKPLLHLHATVAGDNYKAMAGHVVEAQVSLTAEIIIETIKGNVYKEFDKKTGLNLFKFNNPSVPIKAIKK